MGVYFRVGLTFILNFFFPPWVYTMIHGHYRIRKSSFIFLNIFRPWPRACGISVTQPGIEPTLLAMEA